MTIVFETERLVLKEFNVADAQGFYELILDPEVIRYTGDAPFHSVAEAEGAVWHQYACSSTDLILE